FLRTDVESEKDLGRAIALEEERRRGSSLPKNSSRWQALMYSDHVHYTEQLRRYHAVFPREQVLVLIYEDYRADNEATVRQVLRFLDVSEEAPVQAVEVNPATRMRSPRVNELVRSLYLGRTPATRIGKTAIKSVTPQRLRRRALGAQRRMQ